MSALVQSLAHVGSDSKYASCQRHGLSCGGLHSPEAMLGVCADAEARPPPLSRPATLVDAEGNDIGPLGDDPPGAAAADSIAPST